jgi:hypothetical protein
MGMGHGAWGMAHGAWRMGHGAWGMVKIYALARNQLLPNP